MFKLLSIVLISSSVFAQPYCPQDEAQVIGKVNGVKHFQGKCKVYADFTDYQVSGICPLFEEDVANEGVFLEGEDCSLTAGDDFSGYLVRKFGEKTITLD